CLQGISQNYKMTVGEEIKLKKGTADLDIIFADNTGLYFTEERASTRVLTFGGVNISHKLYKLDKGYGEVFEKEYKRELKGLEFESFQALGNDLYMFATDYDRKSRQFKVYGQKVDKSTGDLLGDFKDPGDYELE